MNALIPSKVVHVPSPSTLLTIAFLVAFTYPSLTSWVSDERSIICKQIAVGHKTYRNTGHLSDVIRPTQTYTDCKTSL